jgi:hypothetical protein
MEEFSINGIKKISGLAEASHNNVEMAITDLQNNKIVGFVHCKDYFQDMFYSFFHSDDDEGKYGFYWKCEYNDSLANKRKIRVLVRKHNNGNVYTNLDDKLGKVREYLNLVCRHLDINEFKVKAVNGIITIDVPVKYFKYPVISSMMFYFFRTSLEYDEGTLIEFTDKRTKEDARYWLQHSKLSILLQKESLKSLKKVKWDIFTSDLNGFYDDGDNGDDDDNEEYSGVHNNSGFCNYYKKLKK